MISDVTVGLHIIELSESNDTNFGDFFVFSYFLTLKIAKELKSVLFDLELYQFERMGKQNLVATCRSSPWRS